MTYTFDVYVAENCKINIVVFQDIILVYVMIAIRIVYTKGENMFIRFSRNYNNNNFCRSVINTINVVNVSMNSVTYTTFILNKYIVTYVSII